MVSLRLKQETLVRVAIWCIGEYGDLLVNNVGMLGIEDPITVRITIPILLIISPYVYSDDLASWDFLLV